jgi:hypothetical protein
VEMVMTKEFIVLVVGLVFQFISAVLYFVYRGYVLKSNQGRGWISGTTNSIAIFGSCYLVLFFNNMLSLFLPALFTYMTLFGFLFPLFKRSWSRDQSNTFREGAFLSLLVFLASFGVVYALSSTG